MRIRSIEIRKLIIPMLHGFVLSSGNITCKETILAKLHTEDGLIGYGEASSLNYLGFGDETNDSAIETLKNLIAPKIINKDFTAADDFVASLSEIAGHFTAKAGVEFAFWHLLSQYQNKSLSELFGGTRDKIAVGESIGIKHTIKETLNEIELRLSQGFQRIKIKIKPGWDIEVVKAVRHKWPDIDMLVDANAAYNFAEHQNIFLVLDGFNLSMIEQPFAAQSVSDHAKLQKIITTAICLDESVNSLQDLKAALSLGAIRFLNIKPIRVGGILESLKLHDYAAEHGIGVWCGGMFETGIGRAFNIALASNSNFIYPADMSPSQFYFAEDLIEPSYKVDQNGYIDVPTSAGLGYDIRDDIIQKYTTEKILI